MGKALVLTVGGVLTALLNVLFADKLKASIAWFTASLLDLAVRRLPEGQRERFAEEWASHLSDVSGDIGKIVFARGKLPSRLLRACNFVPRDMQLSTPAEARANSGWEKSEG